MLGDHTREQVVLGAVVENRVYFGAGEEATEANGVNSLLRYKALREEVDGEHQGNKQTQNIVKAREEEVQVKALEVLHELVGLVLVLEIFLERKFLEKPAVVEIQDELRLNGVFVAPGDDVRDVENVEGVIDGLFE